jgi:hypothetical protein
LILVGSVGLLAYPFGISLVDGSAAVGLSASLFVLAAAGIMAAFTTLYYALAATQRIFAGINTAACTAAHKFPSRFRSWPLWSLSASASCLGFCQVVW